MKRMSEVFELPVAGFELEYIISDDESAMCEDYAAHAINHVDALADALARMVEISGQIGGGPAGFYTAILDAKSALNAYRGAK